MLGRVATIFEMIKWQHTVFALPMALASAALAGSTGPDRTTQWWALRVLLIVFACFFARSAAMAYNRLVDRDVDATNPRTAGRPTVTGEVSPRFTLIFVILMSAAFIGTAALINDLSLFLSIPVLAVLFGYSHAKRFTVAAHFWLGAALALAPIGAWIAVLGSLESWTPVMLALAVVVWVAGFDILYALADIEHDRREGLFSIPAKLGARRSMDVAALLHAVAFGMLVVMAIIADLGMWFYLGLVTAGAMLLLEHRLVRPGDLSRLPTAFLTLNGLFSLAVLVGVLTDVFFAWIGR